MSASEVVLKLDTAALVKPQNLHTPERSELVNWRMKFTLYSSWFREAEAGRGKHQSFFFFVFFVFILVFFFFFFCLGVQFKSAGVLLARRALPPSAMM